MKKLLFILLFLMACRCPQPNSDLSNGPDASINDAESYEASLPDVVTETESKPKPSVTQRILLIGDSEVRYVDWYFAPMHKPNEIVSFDSKPGTTIGWWNSGHFQYEMSKYPNIDVVIVFLGTNNFNFSYLQPLQNIIDTIAARHIKCIWVGPTNVRMRGWQNLHIVGPLIKEATAGTCTYFDTEADNISLADGIHPTQEGAVKWLQDIWKVKESL